MPAQTAIWLTVVVAAFGGFAVVLAWADHYTAGKR
ncbi:hypothetical protein GGQ86_001559 [Xanthobacter flavus]|uniref:Uncharacterized protein n=1 Tax=Xanthobacter flavus TaxID=281 RepID=A0ABU1KE40_XANFL|nr:hypothetical protein [Xanthobacter flavus]NMN57497.1 hypothetical protein [Xanthobacter sp. SG618]